MTDLSRQEREALVALVDWIDLDLDLSDKFSVEQAVRGELVGCTRPKECWERGDTVIKAARAALAAREEPQDKDLEVSRLLLQVATERERTAQALAERDEALAERDEAEGYRTTVSDELVERMAKAIYEAGRGPHRVRHGDRDTPQFPWDKVPVEPKSGYRMQARAAIAALFGAAREDTERPDVRAMARASIAAVAYLFSDQIPEGLLEVLGDADDDLIDRVVKLAAVRGIERDA